MLPKNRRNLGHAKGQASSNRHDSRTVDHISNNSTSQNLPKGNSIENVDNLPSSQSATIEQNAANSKASTRGDRGGLRGSTTAAVSSRFKPKNVRRSATELAEIAKKEETRKAVALAEHMRQQSRLARGRGKQRGRGDTMGRGRGAIGSASSIFGVTPEGLKKSSGMLSLRNSGATGLSSSGATGRVSVKNEGSSYSASSGLGSREKSSNLSYAPQYPGDDEDVIRVDIENINLISEGEEEADPSYAVNQKVSKKARLTAKGGLRPVRLHREEHKERVTIVKTTSNTPAQFVPKFQDKSEDGLFVTDEMHPFDYKKEIENVVADGNNRENSIEPRIKQEPTLDENLGTVPNPATSPQPSRIQTEISSAFKQNINDALSASISTFQPDSKGAPELKLERVFIKKRRYLNKNGKKFVIQSEEDRAEYERHLGDIEILANELGSLQECTSSDTQVFDGDEIVEKTEAVQEVQDKKEGRLYLFQFPPVLPALINPPSDDKSGSSIKIKKECNEHHEELESLGNSRKGKSISKEVDVHPPAVKLEVDELIDQKEEISERTETVQEEGFIGKLVVRESGRVELSWGGISLLVERGVDASFLTTGVIVDNVERGPTGGGVPEGKALGMGQIMGKFVVTPDWLTMI